MKKILLLVSCLSLATSLFAKEVEVTAAQNIARNFYNTKVAKSNNASAQTISVSLAGKNNNQSAQNAEANLFYVFNINSNDGFVIISADDAVTPVLGYSASGKYNASNLPPQFAGWMENCNKQILFAKENNVQPSAEIKTKWHDLIVNKSNSNSMYGVQAVNELLSTTWNQSPYYNDLCPGGSVTGCVATAMAQIMKYWNYPATGTGSHSYTHATYGTLSANFGATTYNWSNMPNDVQSPNNDVATIMFHCGVSVDMNYSPQESGAWVIALDDAVCAENSFKDYFGYDATTIHGYKRSSYSTTDWKNMLKGDLDASRPIQYAGFGANQSGGHTWVCDGYDGNDFFHMNWGWGGAENGYFDIDNLVTTSYSFNYDQEALIGIKPANGGGGGGGTSTTINMYSSIVVAPSTIISGQPFTVNADVINAGTSTYSGNFCAALFTSGGTFVDYVQTLSASGSPLQAGYHYNGGITFSSSGITTADGSYIIGIFYTDSAGNWTSPGNASYASQINVDVVSQGGGSSPDSYEINNTEQTAFSLPINWAGNTAQVLTTGSTFHTTTDYDYYKLNLQSGYNYTITARAHDSYNSGNGNTYTVDVNWSYNTGSGFSSTFDDVMSGNIQVANAGTVIFFVQPYFAGDMGTYLMDITITRTPNVGIDELTSANNLFVMFPNPASDFLNVKLKDNVSFTKFQVVNMLGSTVLEMQPSETLTKIDISALHSGIYFLIATDDVKTYTSRFVISR